MRWLKYSGVLEVFRFGLALAFAPSLSHTLPFLHPTWPIAALVVVSLPYLQSTVEMAQPQSHPGTDGRTFAAVTRMSEQA